MSEKTQTVPAADDSRHGWLARLIDASIATCIATLALALYFLPAAMGNPLTDAAEARVAGVAREMLQNGDYVLPTLGGEPHLTQPPMAYWLTALSSATLFGGAGGDSLALARAAQLPAALSAAAAVFLIILAGCAFFGRTAGIVAGLAFAVTPLVANYAQSGYGDATLMLACAASLAGMAALLSSKSGPGAALFTGLALGVGILTKGHVPLVLLGVPVIVELILRRKDAGWSQVLFIALAFVIALLVATPWFVLVERRHPGAVAEMAREAGDAIYAPSSAEPKMSEGGPASSRASLGFGYYFYRSALGLLPWTPLLLLGLIVLSRPLKSANPTPQAERDAARFFALYAAFGLVLFLIAQRKSEHYLLPLLPALALAAGAAVGRLSSPGGVYEERMGWCQIGLGLLGTVALALMPLWPAIASNLRLLGVARADLLATRATAISALIGWFYIPIALAFFGVCFLCARFWTTGNGGISVAIVAVFMSVALVAAAARPGERARIDAFWANVNALKEKTDKFDINARYFAPKGTDAILTVYTGRKVRDLKALLTETPSGDSRAYLFVHGKTTSVLGVPIGDAAANADGYTMIEMRSFESDLRAAVKKTQPAEK